jgi:hypothetical protein
MVLGINQTGKIDSFGEFDFLTGQRFDQINVPTQAGKNVFTTALKELTPETMKRLNIDKVMGTMMRIAIVDHENLWTTYKGKMIEAVEKLESLIKRIVEAQQGILVKIVDDSFICFFPDRNRVRSSIHKGVYTGCRLRVELEEHPIHLEDHLNHCTLQIIVFLSYGPTYRRTLHIQRKILHDYYGEVVDNVLNQECTVVHPEHICFLVNDSRHKVGEEVPFCSMRSMTP